MMQKNFLAAERFYECLDCHESVFNPICPDCLTLQIEVWLSSISSYPMKDKIMKRIKEYVIATKNLAPESTICVACGKPTATLCPYCFTNYVFILLKCMDAHREILREFLQFFNYDFDHTGYTKDAEKLGVI
ncbi:hypothetical protein A3K73_08200 [Candidatus Pacearchaeota archaeon RBG_13_36_9]|nr:MAG: hypothetical protein A3K73_08200 [Candidatus Pacearchaeota archaeon RBG_13_36_9]